VKRRRSRRVQRRAGAVAVAALAAGLLWIGAPRVLARVPFFRVRQIDLVGVKYLAPDALIAALRLPAGASVFGDARLLADRVKGVSGVADASVVRRLPGTLEVLVSEVEPAAFVPATRGGSLVAVDGSGRALPFDPERTGLDLPVVATADAGVVGVLALVQAVDPALFQRVTGARSARHGDVLLELGAYRVLLRRDAGPEVVRAVALVGQDLAATGRAYTELDARFAGQVVVRQRMARGKGRA
jgi:cell division septal protein FtsQ